MKPPDRHLVNLMRQLQILDIRDRVDFCLTDKTNPIERKHTEGQNIFTGDGLRL